ncbi:MAG: hypothetical protein U9N35_08270 [Euryarchaeota archaeon]|nr:hypothetical protein [Euryarchaeota archaeon]
MDKDGIVAIGLSAVVIALSFWRGQMLMGICVVSLIVITEIAYRIYLVAKEFVENEEE